MAAVLLAWATDEELTDTKLRYQFDKIEAIPQSSRQCDRSIDEPALPVGDLDALYQEIIQSISPILALLVKTSICDPSASEIPVYIT